MRIPRGKENDVLTLKREATQTCSLPQHSLAPVTPHGITQAPSCHEGNPALGVHVRGERGHTHEPRALALTTREDLFEILTGLDGLHRAELDGEALAALGTTTGKDGTTTLGRHTGAEAMGLGALALVRLIRTLHDANLLVPHRDAESYE